MKNLFFSVLCLLLTSAAFAQGYQSVNNFEEIVLETEKVSEANVELNKVKAIYKIVAFDSWIDNVTVKNQQGKIVSNVDYTETKGVFLNLRYIQSSNYNITVTTADGKTKSYSVRN
ncbi:MAG: hypothetical protein HKN48_04270 [Flavobacteriaceae bacterium]|nr:hypothetical protein [Flavobacteriaceae bacterium]